jgi:hypothetical protein
MKDPLTYITDMQSLFTPENIAWWSDNIAEMTATKKTVTGSASVDIVNLIKSLPMGLSRKMSEPEAKKNRGVVEGFANVFAFGVDTIVPFLKTIMNFTSFAMDFVIPFKSLAKAAFFADMASKNRGTAIAENYAMSSAKYVSRTVIAAYFNYTAFQLLSIPGMIVAGSPKDDDEEEKKFAKEVPRNSFNHSALLRYIRGEDPTYQDGDKYESLAYLGVFGIMLYSHSAVLDSARKKEAKIIESSPRNVSPKMISGIEEIMDKVSSPIMDSFTMGFGSIPYFIDQSWFVGVSSVFQAITDKERNGDKLMSTWTGAVVATWWGFSSYAQQLSDIYRESVGKPVSDIRLPGSLKTTKREDYPKVFGDFLKTRFWNTVWGKNELIHKYMVDSQMDVEYISHGVYGRPVTPVLGKQVEGLDIAKSVMLPSRAVITGLSPELRFYMAIYKNQKFLNIPGYKMSLAEPSLGKEASIAIPKQNDPLGDPKNIGIIIPPKDYNTLVPMAGKIVEKLQAKLLKPYMDMEIKGQKVTPEMIMDPKLDNVKEIVEIKRGMAVAISEANKIVDGYLKPWGLFKDEPIINLIDLDKAQIIAKVDNLASSQFSTYERYDISKGKMDKLSVNIFVDPEIAKDLYDLASASIDMYVREAKKAIKIDQEWGPYDEYLPMTPEQEAQMKKGYRR